MKYFPKLAEKFKELLNKGRAKNIAIFGHVRPDGDCISSMFSMADAFRKSGANRVVCINEHPLPRLYENFAYGERIILAKDFVGEDFETVCVDCSSFARTGEHAKKFAALKFLGTIDHHVSDHSDAEISIIDSSAAAAAELIAGLMLDNGFNISAKNATRLYMGMMMDTRQLTTSSVDERTFRIATEMVAKGANPAQIAVELYQRESFAKMKLLATYLQSLTMHYNGRVCIGILKKGAYEQTGAIKADSDGLVDFARSIDGVEIAALLECIPSGVKGSLRSKDPKFKVNEIAGEFGGGGHMAASGFTAESFDINSFMPKFLESIGEHLRDIDTLEGR